MSANIAVVAVKNENALAEAFLKEVLKISLKTACGRNQDGIIGGSIFDELGRLLSSSDLKAKLIESARKGEYWEMKIILFKELCSRPTAWDIPASYPWSTEEWDIFSRSVSSMHNHFVIMTCLH